jgi:hypothetical protein
MRRVVLSAVLLLAAAHAWAASSVVAGGTNILAAANGGRVVKVSSQAKDDNGQIMPHWMATNAIDGLYVVGNHTPKDSYGWSTQHPPTPQAPEWIIFAFSADAKPHLISRVVIDPTTDDPPYIGRGVKDIEIRVSTADPDGPYKTIGRYMVVNRPIKQAFDFPPVECKYLQLLLLSNHGSDKCVELGEVEVYEGIVGDNVLDEYIVRLENLLNDLKRYRDGVVYQQSRRSLEDVLKKPEVPAPTPAPEPAPAPAPQ